MRNHPLLYEINALRLVKRLSRRDPRCRSLSSVPDREWRALAERFDALWLMGAWRRSPAAREQALASPRLRRAYDEALPDWTGEDVCGSPYAVHAYVLDPALGGPGDLRRLRARLNRLGLRLIVDFVPNHLARDHPWVAEHPEWLVSGSETAVREHPDWFYSPAPGRWHAHGRDPNFPPWTDTVQLNFASPGLREALIGELVSLSDLVDGVRCDMAMLPLREVFERVWAWALPDHPRAEGEFWGEAIRKVRQRRPDFLFLAEAYWGLESKLIDLGFDAAYDKTLYDLLRAGDGEAIRAHLRDHAHREGATVRFVENHDEARALTAFGRERSRAAAVIVATLPGVRLFHDGQLSGRRVRVPVQLAREPDEPEDADTVDFYDRVLRACGRPGFHVGEWALLSSAPAWEGNDSHRNLLAWTWRDGERLHLVVVNFSAAFAQGRVCFGLPAGLGESVSFRDGLSGALFTGATSEVRESGLYVELAPWSSHLLDLSPAGP